MAGKPGAKDALINLLKKDGLKIASKMFPVAMVISDTYLTPPI